VKKYLFTSIKKDLEKFNNVTNETGNLSKLKKKKTTSLQELHDLSSFRQWVEQLSRIKKKEVSL